MTLPASSPMDAVISGILRNANNGVVKLNEEQASAVSARIGEIPPRIEAAVAQIEGQISEAQSFWTGEAAEKFCGEMKTLISETKKMSELILLTKQRFDKAAGILITADQKAAKDTASLSTANIFNY